MDKSLTFEFDNPVFIICVHFGEFSLSSNRELWKKNLLRQNLTMKTKTEFVINVEKHNFQRLTF